MVIVSLFCTVFAILSLLEPGIERVKALADISRSAQCCHSNEIPVPIANPPDSAQLEGTPTFSPTYIRSHYVRWGPSSPTERDTAAPHSSAHVSCDQTVAHLSNC